MKVTQEKLPASQVGLKIEIPAETTKQAYEKVLQNLSRTVKIPGFRQGKVPRQVLLQRLGAQQVKAAAIEELLDSSLKQAIEQAQIEALGNYNLTSTLEDLLSQFKPGEPLTFTASVDVPPLVNLGEYNGLSVTAEETKVEPDAVENFLEERRVEQATLVPVESRPAQMGDVVVVDYVGRFTGDSEEDEGSVIPNGEAKDFEIELGEGKFLEDILQGIVGMNPDQNKEVPVTFPEDYPLEDLAGKSSVFSITLKEIKEKELPELDDDFAQEVSDQETLAELREYLQQEFQEKADQETQASKEEALINALLEKVEVELPETLIDQELQTILTQTAIQMQQLGMDVKRLFTEENLPQLRERSRPDAIQSLRQSLALKEIATRESLTVEESEIEAKSKELMKELAGQEVDPDRLREFVESDLLKLKAIKWLEDHGTIELVPKGTITEEEETEAEDTAVTVTELETTDAASQTIEVPAEPVSE
ncbi:MULTISPECIES: trigger factor [Moorena]|uniref:Trigger factor n=1 Tax=Moorena producens 3L TaxID=489825 RepID=F4XTU5_9CYAN|nr:MULTISPECIES: trigger factor [Moorena]NEQ15338.1 trigger factor [Moorena sp. SIO3E2]EGJ31921.1 trigger factor [Moorena producens 3L]NEP64319.1 trigger factor [Moorena sp. SIO3A5]NEQ04464.1 trigger factor [Moorena sp. SIO4E2]NER89187.1 trigger factor [Moorena sp. SIO3A2]